jgi:hypothetical protein
MVEESLPVRRSFCWMKMSLLAPNNSSAFGSSSFAQCSLPIRDSAYLWLARRHQPQARHLRTVATSSGHVVMLLISTTFSFFSWWWWSWFLAGEHDGKRCGRVTGVPRQGYMHEHKNHCLIIDLFSFILVDLSIVMGFYFQRKSTKARLSY